MRIRGEKSGQARIYRKGSICQHFFCKKIASVRAWFLPKRRPTASALSRSVDSVLLPGGDVEVCLLIRPAAKPLSNRLALVLGREREDLAISNQPRMVVSKTATSSSLIMSNRFSFLVASTCLVITALITSLVSADIAGFANCPRR